jgi:hypothetical protein
MGVSDLFVSGFGAVSPAGWTVPNLRDTVTRGEPLTPVEIQRPSSERPLQALRVPPPNPRPAFLGHARLRRASPVSHFALSAVLEALGSETDHRDTAVITCVLSGCVNYSRRFYDETLKDPATASPLLFPETVFNAPSSHISAFLGSRAINYTLVGDAGAMLTGVALAARWLAEGKAERCVVVGAEEIDWLTADALALFDRSKVLSEGAGAVLITRTRHKAAARLERITDEFLYSRYPKSAALAGMKEQFGEFSADTLLCDSTSSARGISKQEYSLWANWPGPRLSTKKVLGEGLMASAAWQLVLAVDAIAMGRASEALVSVAGFHQHAIGARLVHG